MRKVSLAVVCLVLLTLLWTAPVFAFGVGLGPQNMEIKNALRGMEYERTITVVNPSKDETAYTLRADGSAGGWLSFYTLETKEPIQKMTIAGESSFYVMLKVQVPPDITNGDYTATIYAETASSEGIGETGVSAVMQAKSELTVGVSGNQIIDGTVASVMAYDTEAGVPLRIEVKFKNTGNVAVQPKISVVINQEKSKIAEVNYEKTSVKPESLQDIQVEWPTTLNQTGDYTAKAAVTLNEKILYTGELAFKVHPPGTFTKQGEFTSLNYVGQPSLDTTLKIQAGFKNTGEGDARAKLITEVYRDGNLIDTVKSEDTLVPVGKTGTIISYLKLTKSGKYNIKALISYEGKQTELKELSFDVSSAGNPGLPDTSGKDGEQPGLSYLYLIFGGVLVITAGIVVAVMKAKR